MRFCPVAELKRMITGLVVKRLTLSRPPSRCIQRVRSAQYIPISQTLFMLSIAINRAEPVCASVIIKLVSEPNPLRPLRDLQYGLGEMVFGGCRHLEYMNI